MKEFQNIEHIYIDIYRYRYINNQAQLYISKLAFKRSKRKLLTRWANFDKEEKSKISFQNNLD